MPSARILAAWRRPLRRSPLLALRLPAEIPAPQYSPSLPLLRRAASLQISHHLLRISAAARVGHDMRQRDERPALLLRALGLLLLVLDGGKAKLPRLDRPRSPPLRKLRRTACATPSLAKRCRRPSASSPMAAAVLASAWPITEN